MSHPQTALPPAAFYGANINLLLCLTFSQQQILSCICCQETFSSLMGSNGCNLSQAVTLPCYILAATFLWWDRLKQEDVYLFQEEGNRGPLEIWSWLYHAGTSIHE